MQNNKKPFDPTTHPVNDRMMGRHVLSLALQSDINSLRSMWSRMDAKDRLDMFGNGHAKEIDLLLKSLGKYDTSHLKGDSFGDHLIDLHDGQGMSDPDAAAVLGDPSGVRLAHRAVMLAPGSDAHRSTMGILNARYKENSNASAAARSHREAPTPISAGRGSADGHSSDHGYAEHGSAGSSHPPGGVREPALVRELPAHKADDKGAGESADGQSEVGAGDRGAGGVDSGRGTTGAKDSKTPATATATSTTAATRKITGSADIPLSKAGEEQVKEMASKPKVPFDIVLCAPSKRSLATARYFSSDPVELPALDGWARGELEGKPAEEMKGEVRKLILNPDEKPAGKSEESGKPGQSYNAFLRPLLEAVQAVLSSTDDGEHVLFVTSGGNLQAIDAWVKAGMPKDLKFSLAGIAAKPYWSVTGKLFRLEDSKLAEVTDDAERGPGRYFMEHGETEWNSKRN